MCSESKFELRQVCSWETVLNVTFTFLWPFSSMLLIPVKWLQRNLAHFNGCIEPIEKPESVSSIIMIGRPLKLAVYFSLFIHLNLIVYNKLKIWRVRTVRRVWSIRSRRLTFLFVFDEFPIGSWKIVFDQSWLEFIVIRLLT